MGKLNQSGVEEVKLSWNVSEEIKDQVHLLINNQFYKLSELNYIDLNVNQINSMTLLLGDISKFVTPGEFTLHSPYPNPFNPTTLIDLSIGQMEHINATIYNIHGQVVEVICNEKIEAGKHQFEWNAKNHSSGLYFLRVQSKSQSATQKLILIK